MDLIADYIEPAELTGYARAALADLEVNQFTLARWLPSRPIDDLEYRFTSGGEGLIEAASFRAYDTPSTFGSRPGARRVTGELPPISRQIRLSEYDRLRLRANADDAILNATFDDALRMTRAVAARMELARGEALYRGGVNIAENGVFASVDYGRAGGNTVVAGTAWTNTASATPLTDLVSWSDTRTSNGANGPAGAIVTSTRVARLMQRNSEVIAAVAGAAAGRTRVTMEELNALLLSESLPAVFVYDAQINVGGVPTRVIPDDRLLLLPAPGDPTDPESSELGATLWGTTAEALEADYGIEDGEEPGIVAGQYKSQKPLALFTDAAGIGLPVLANPNLSFAADVS